MKKQILGVCVLTILLLSGCLGYAYYRIMRCPFTQESGWIHVSTGTTTEGLRKELMLRANYNDPGIWFDMAVSAYKIERRLWDNSISGAYHLEAGIPIGVAIRKVAYHKQDPVKLTFSGTRSIADLAGRMAHHVMADSTALMRAIYNPDFMQQANADSANIGSIFLPDTYEVYWDIAPNKLMQRMLTEYQHFWNDSRKQKAEALHLTPLQAATICSIAEEETANRKERGVVARLYWNRLQKGMLLQADPTVKYAVGDPTLRRILNVHLSTPSPYNTYLHPGLPPGPIRIVEKATIDAFLASEPHNYLYMCAKEDFSGLHNFATTLSQHNQNAARYHKALNAKKIK